MLVHIIPDNFLMDDVIPLIKSEGVEMVQRFACLIGKDIRYSGVRPMTRFREAVDYIPLEDFSSYLAELKLKHKKIVVALHSLTTANRRVIKLIQHEYPMVWISWGIDIFHFRPLLGRTTTTWLHEVFSGKFRWKISMVWHLIKYGILVKVVPFLIDEIRIRACFKLCYTIIESDYTWYKSVVGVNSIYLPRYGGEFPCGMICGLDRLPPQSRQLDDVNNACHQNIMVGNCSIPNYNHRDVFKLLKGIKGINERDIVVPLSYGNKQYGDSIVCKGEAMFGNRFKPIREVMPKEEYLNIISSCGILIANHLQQAGLGTLELAFLTGVKVYLNPRNPIYEFLQRVGFIVFPFTKKTCNSSMFLCQLSLTEKKRNRQVCLDYWGESRIKKCFNKFLSDCRLIEGTMT